VVLGTLPGPVRIMGVWYTMTETRQDLITYLNTLMLAALVLHSFSFI